MAVAGMIGAYTKTQDPFWMMSVTLWCLGRRYGLYYPGLAFVLAFIGGVTGPMVASFVEKMGIDDANSALQYTVSAVSSASCSRVSSWAVTTS